MDETVSSKTNMLWELLKCFQKGTLGIILSATNHGKGPVDGIGATLK